MEVVLVAMWQKWYGKQISFDETGNCVVDKSISISHRDVEKKPRFLRRAWVFFWSRKELIDFEKRFKKHRQTFYHTVREFAFDIDGSEQILHKELSEIADNVLCGIDADWVREYLYPKDLFCGLVSVRDDLHR